MLKLFSRLLKRDVHTAPGPVHEENEVHSNEQLLRAHFSFSEEAGQALGRFVSLISGHLGSGESERLSSLAVSRLRLGDTADDAIADSLLGDDGQRPGKWLLLQVDWKATEEVEWQANELLAAAGLTERWQLQDGPDTTVPQALLAFSAWAEHLGFHLLHLDLGHDAYYALLAPADRSAAMLRAALEAGLKLQDSGAFAAENARD